MNFRTHSLVARTLTLLLTVAAVGIGAVGCSNTHTEGAGTDPFDPNVGSNGNLGVDFDVRYKVDPAKVTLIDKLPTDPKQEVSVRITHIGNKGILRFHNPRFANVTADLQKGMTTSLTTAMPTTASYIDITNPGGFYDFKVTYQPVTAGVRTMNLLLDTNATVAGQKTLTIPIEVVSAGSSLVIQPNPVDFGNVKTGDAPTVDVQLFNYSTKPLKIVGVTLNTSGSEDFSLANLPDPTVDVAAGASVHLSVIYKPTKGNSDTTTLQVETDDKRKITAPVLGNEIAPLISVFPTKLDYDSMKLGETKDAIFQITNKGLATLVVSDVKLSSLSTVLPADVKIDPPPPYTLEPNSASQKVTVTLTASKPLPANSAVGSILVDSNDASDPEIPVPMFAHTDTPKIRVSVDDAPCSDPTQDCVADYAFVGKANPPAVLYAKRKVTLYNEGSAPLGVSEIAITDDALSEFSFDPAMIIPPCSNPPQPTTIDPQNLNDFNVRFQNKGASGQVATAKLHIHSADAATPDFVVLLVAHRADGTSCKIDLIPQPLNFGLLPYGKAKLLPVTVKNSGTGPCAFIDATLVSCYQAPSAFGGAAGNKCTAASSPFYAIGPKATTLFTMQPGDQGKLLIDFTAPDTLAGITGPPPPNTVTEIDGLVVLKYKDVSTGVVSNYPNVDPSNFQTIGTAKPNLIAKVGLSKVQVLPDEIDFGVVTLGCKSPISNASIYNQGVTDVAVTKLTLDGCGPEVSFVNKPAIPKDGLPISQKTPQTFKIQYGPQKVAKLQCQLTITTGQNGSCTDTTGATSGACDKTSDCTKTGDICLGDSFSVPLTGEGTLDTEWTDIYNQADGKQVDVLFVIDNSGSMSEEQSNIATSFQSFVSIASVFNDDYHIGIVTTDMDSAAESGRLQVKGSTPYRYVTKNQTNPGGMLETKANQGTNGSSVEQGFAAAEAALTLPLTYDAKKVCKTDADCGGDTCTTDPTTGLLGCGGTNRGFLRKYADLEVVILSDENDQSPSDLSYYENKFLSIKGAANKNLVHFHAITGLAGGCNGSGGQAEDCGRYVSMANYFGGQAASICDLNFAPVLQNIGAQAFGVALEYFLTRTPDPSTIDVKINATPCPQGAKSWSYDPAANAVIFAQNGTCVPQNNDKIYIHYKMLCVQ
jgi:hypothetical protein